MSGFTSEEVQAQLHEHDTVDTSIIDKQTGRAHNVPVPICKPENFGAEMAIDDKGLGGEGYTVISNKTTGKIAVLIQSTKAGVIANVLHKLPVAVLFGVKSLTKDLAEGYDWVSRNVFQNACRVADKFHVIALGLEALQAVRIRYRQEVLRAEYEERETYKQQQREEREWCRKESKIYIAPKKHRQTKTERKRYENGESTKELLARSRYLLFKLKSKWKPSQQQRADILFREFPEIKQAYNLVTHFRSFYNLPIGNRRKAKKELTMWYQEVSKTNLEEMYAFANTIQKHEGQILNYFEHGHTNAYAESLNAQIERFLNNNTGMRDKDFFHFRLQGYFS